MISACPFAFPAMEYWFVCIFSTGQYGGFVSGEISVFADSRKTLVPKTYVDHPSSEYLLAGTLRTIILND